MSKKNAFIVVIVVVVLVILGLILYERERSSSSANTATNTPTFSVADLNTQMQQTIPAFASAVQLEDQNEYASAIPELQKALPSAKNTQQQVTLQFHLVQDYEITGDNTDAVALLQQIASNASYQAVTEALAVEDIGSLYVNDPGVDLAPLIFAHAPYSYLYVSTSTNQSARNLFQYAASTYPLPASEYYIANSYLNSIINTDLQNATSPAGEAEFASLEQDAKQSFATGETTLAIAEKDPPTLYYTLTAQLVRATVLGKMQIIGDTSLGNADQAFQALLTSYASQKLTADGAVRLRYAYFLANAYGASQASNLDSVLEPIYQDATHRGPLVEPYLKQFIGATSSPTKVDLALLATIDPQFKTFLASLGWTSADFAASSNAAQ